jgi:hypothetical protein
MSLQTEKSVVICDPRTIDWTPHKIEKLEKLVERARDNSWRTIRLFDCEISYGYAAYMVSRWRSIWS